jgi:hypothetical protein
MLHPGIRTERDRGPFSRRSQGGSQSGRSLKRQSQAVGSRDVQNRSNVRVVRVPIFVDGVGEAFPLRARRAWPQDQTRDQRHEPHRVEQLPRQLRERNLGRDRSPDADSDGVVKQSVRELRRLATSLKNKPCLDCIEAGLSGLWPVVAMQFDHVRGIKIAEISVFVRSGDEAGLLLEIGKCEAVCANHHAIRTQARGKSPETRDRMSRSQAAKWSSPEMRELARKNASAVWDDPARRAARVSTMKGAKARKRLRDQREDKSR